MKIILTGCRGQLGLEIQKQTSELAKNIQVIPTDLHNMDITDNQAVFALCRAERPDVIINCAAYTNVDGCETDEAAAFRANAIGARNLAAAALAVDAKMLQVSTDYVFDGSGHTPKREYDPVNPQSVYGKSKALGEAMVRAANPRHFILRTAWLYGEGHNFVQTMLRLAKDKKELWVVNDQIGSPTSTVDLAKCILDLIQTECYGTYHATCEGACSWYEFARAIFAYQGIAVQVIPITTEELSRPAPRPKYSVLENWLLNLQGMNTFRPWEEALQEYLQIISK